MNPLFKKFVHEGDNPTTYIPANKRREIYDYMGKVNYNKHHESKWTRAQASLVANRAGTPL